MEAASMAGACIPGASSPSIACAFQPHRSTPGKANRSGENRRKEKRNMPAF
jgi:hypothetical protein